MMDQRLMRCLVLIAGVSATTIAPADDSRTRAFPNAEGFGAYAKGGRGGRVLFVTNLNDDGPGSLRAAVEEEGPRYVLFQVSGTIELSSGLKIRAPYITIAGQSAPGDGICVKAYGVSIRTHDVVMRHLRVRPGDEPGPSHKARGQSFAPDAITVESPSRDIILDHCSASWSIDECLSVSGAEITNVTVQWCMITESLNDSFHQKGPHGYGSLLRCSGNVTFHHNLYAHHRSRSPRPGTYGDGVILLDFRNNVIYDSRGYSAKDPVRMNYVGNFIRRSRDAAFSVGGKKTSLYVAGNHLDDGKKGNDPWRMIKGAAPENRRAEPFEVATVATQPAKDAFQSVLEEAGATLPRRDAVDTRVIRQVENRTGGLIDSQKEVGGWPTLETHPARADTDGDGLPDAWERQHALNLEGADHNGDEDRDGYTNLEEFLNGTDPRSSDRG